MSLFSESIKYKLFDWFDKNKSDGVLYPHETEYLRPAFAGDVKAAYKLSVGLRNELRGHIAVNMWQCKVDKAAFREYLASAWEHDHRYVIDAAKTRRNLSLMFRYAMFALPDELPEVVEVWRGTSKLTAEEAKAGYAWTTDRDVACWFAMRFAEENGSPLLLTAHVAKKDIVFYTQNRGESEALLVRIPKGVRVDGDAIDWQEGYLREQASIKNNNAELLVCTL